VTWIEIEVRSAHSIPRESVRCQWLSEVNFVVGGQYRGAPTGWPWTKDERGRHWLDVGDLIAKYRGPGRVNRCHEVDRSRPSRADDPSVHGAILAFRNGRGTEAGGEHKR
jgi:hypothetical protein